MHAVKEARNALLRAIGDFAVNLNPFKTDALTSAIRDRLNEFEQAVRDEEGEA